MLLLIKCNPSYKCYFLEIKTFVRHVRTMFYVRIRFSHSFHFETTQSKSITEITEGIVTEVRHRTEGVLAVFDLMSCATSLFFLFIIFRFVVLFEAKIIYVMPFSLQSCALQI